MDVGVSKVSDDFLAVVLVECHVHDAGLASELDVFHSEGGGADLRATEKVQM